MPQLVKKRRSGWAVLAAGALIASVLAFGAAPAAIAAEQVADAQATWKACLGPATEDRGFTDVSMDNAHYDAINCLAYYGITSGKTADTYDPNSHITRSQMALFLTNAAAKADIELEEAMDMGFTDLGSTGDNRVAAINQLAANGIMPGRTATTFDPTDYVTRADMAQHLFRLLDIALDSVLIDMLPDSVEVEPRDGTGHIELNDDDGDGRGQPVDDYFGDVRRTLPAHMDDIIGAVYELGITAGTNGMVGENGTFSPNANVTRAQMATFIMAALGHTNLRPAGLTAQQTRDDTQVSVRDADFAPVVNQRVEVFYSTFARDAFDRSGRCIDRFVTDSDPSFDECTIDAGDARTDVDGNVLLKPGLGGGLPTITCQTGTPYAAETNPTYVLEAAGLIDPEAEYKLWAWAGSFGDTVDSSTDLFLAVPANRITGLNPAVSAVISGGTRDTVKMGRALVYEVQLVDNRGRPVGPNPTGNQAYTVTVQKREITDATTDPVTTGPTRIISVDTRLPDGNGKFRIVVTNPDPVIGVDNDDVQVTVTVERSAGTGQAGTHNRLRVVDTTGATDASPGAADTAGGFDANGTVIYEASGAGTGENGARRIIGVQAPVEVFSDNAPTATRVSVSPGAAGRELASRNRNSLSVTVLDQYGDPYRAGALYGAMSTVADPVGGGKASQFPNNASANTSGGVSSDSGGRIYFNYNYVDGVGVESLAIAGVQGPAPANTPAPPGTGAATVYWSRIQLAGSEDGKNLLLADPAGRRLIVDVQDATATPADSAIRPATLLFGDDDQFLVGQGPTPLSLAQFQEVLIVGVSPDGRVTFNFNADPTDGTVDTQTTVTWEGFNNNRPNDRAKWTLQGLHCTPPPGGDAESTIS